MGIALGYRGFTRPFNRLLQPNERPEKSHAVVILGIHCVHCFSGIPCARIKGERMRTLGLGPNTHVFQGLNQGV